jgi:hypothetical protein
MARYWAGDVAGDVELVRGFAAAEIDEGWAKADPDIVWNPIDETPVQGIDAAVASLARWQADWDEYDVFREEFVDAGDRVVVATLFRGRGRGSGIKVMDEFTSRAEAFEAVGLSSTSAT